MVFKLLKIRKSVREARQDPGGFAGGQAADVVLGIVAIPAIIAFIGLALFFILGFTSLLGGPLGLFRILFIIGAIVSFLLFIIIRPIIRFIKRGTKRAVDAGVRTVKEITNEPL